ncbi:hypothetical protein AZE42_11463 [Rhizopogon vesiculosus]|uniref:Uncharacterized protein n=1 Tax=Rhizopogon vesiculosus TaxID=180088 RepID=A0A1J8PY36_9AGAM|nr:hypothetical protein AZE42_11463 [Rhizopogon vesiculosus]
MPGITQQPLTDMAEPLPQYTTRPQPGPVPPQYDALPEKFTIGRNNTHHLVRPDQLKVHLQLLAAFDYLKQRVVASESLIAGLEADSEKRWVCFVNLAVERFEKWCLSIKSSDTVEQCLPPIDVAMVWHSYLLNPRQECFSSCLLKPLTRFSDYFSTLLANPDLLTTDTPQHERVSAWERRTQTPYDPFASIATLTHKPINCPRCSQTILAPFIQSDGKGYAQSNFSIDCKCGHPITKEILGLHKLAENAVESKSPDTYFAGTLHTPRNIFDTKSGPTKGSDPVVQILTNVQYDAARMYTALSNHAMRPRLLNKIMSAYTDDRVFSIDLVDVVLRQATFVKKMIDLGWIKPGYFTSEVDIVALQNCVARYHAFLGLMAESPASSFIPTLDIDLAWHTHQLMASRYQSDCLSLVGRYVDHDLSFVSRCVDHDLSFVSRYVDHDEKAEETQIVNTLDLTSRAWNDLYHVPYIDYGSPLPGDTIGQKLERTLPLSFCIETPTTVPSDDGDTIGQKLKHNLPLSFCIETPTTVPSDDGDTIGQKHKHNLPLSFCIETPTTVALDDGDTVDQKLKHNLPLSFCIETPMTVALDDGDTVDQKFKHNLPLSFCIETPMTVALDDGDTVGQKLKHNLPLSFCIETPMAVPLDDGDIVGQKLKHNLPLSFCIETPMAVPLDDGDTVGQKLKHNLPLSFCIETPTTVLLDDDVQV